MSEYNFSVGQLVMCSAYPQEGRILGCIKHANVEKDEYLVEWVFAPEHNTFYHLNDTLHGWHIESFRNFFLSYVQYHLSK